MPIEGIDQHLTKNAFSAHDLNSEGKEGEGGLSILEYQKPHWDLDDDVACGRIFSGITHYNRFTPVIYSDHGTLELLNSDERSCISR